MGKRKAAIGPTRAAFPKIMGINVYSCLFQAKELVRHAYTYVWRTPIIRGSYSIEKQVSVHIEILFDIW